MEQAAIEFCKENEISYPIVRGCIGRVLRQMDVLPFDKNKRLWMLTLMDNEISLRLESIGQEPIKLGGVYLTADRVRAQLPAMRADLEAAGYDPSDWFGTSGRFLNELLESYRLHEVSIAINTVSVGYQMINWE